MKRETEKLTKVNLLSRRLNISVVDVSGHQFNPILTLIMETEPIKTLSWEIMNKPVPAYVIGKMQEQHGPRHLLVGEGYTPQEINSIEKLKLPCTLCQPHQLSAIIPWFEQLDKYLKEIKPKTLVQLYNTLTCFIEKKLKEVYLGSYILPFQVDNEQGKRIAPILSVIMESGKIIGYALTEEFDPGPAVLDMYLNMGLKDSRHLLVTEDYPAMEKLKKFEGQFPYSIRLECPVNNWYEKLKPYLKEFNPATFGELENALLSYIKGTYEVIKNE